MCDRHSAVDGGGGSAAEPLRPVLVPADRGPLWLLLGLLDEGEELHAGVVQVLVHQNTIKKVPVSDLHQPRCLLQLHKVVVLRVENMEEPLLTQRC